MRAHLTEIAVRALKPVDRQFKVWDTSTPGFGVLVNQRSKSWIVMYDSKRRLAKIIGRFPDMPLAKARQEAKRMLLNPEQAADRITFAEAAAQYLTIHCAKNQRPRTRAETERLLTKHLLPELGSKQLASITTAQVLRITDALHATPSAALHLFRAARALFRWTVARRLIKHSPLEMVPPPGEDGERDTVLEDAALKSVWTALDESPFGGVVRLLILTGQRRGQIAALRRSWINEHDKKDIDRDSGISGWVLHDLRRTFATGLQRLGIALPVVEKLLAHRSGSFAGVVGIYQRHSYMPEMREALAKWETYLSAVVSK